MFATLLLLFNALVLSGVPVEAQDTTVTPDFGTCPLTRETEKSVLLAADPEWLPGAKMHDIAYYGLKRLAENGLNDIRLLNFNIFPSISCAQIEKGKWNFTYPDMVMKDFMDACGDASVTIDIETSPDWMWTDSNESTYHTCASDTSAELPPGPRLRCPHWGDPSHPVDPTWRQLAEYYRNVADWYTKGGFVDADGKEYKSGLKYKFKYWEIMNEPNLVREHGFTPQSITDYYDMQVGVMTENGRVRPSEKWLGPSLAGGANPEDWVGHFLDPANHNPQSTPVDGVSFHIYAVCGGNKSAEALEFIFTDTDKKIAGLEKIETLRNQLRPNAELHLTESGIVCNNPRGCVQNNYTCYFRDFDQYYWVASAGQWLYQYLTYAKAANLSSIVHSQLLGYPYKYDGLSGEWPCGSMVSWPGWPADKSSPPVLNAKYWVTLLAVQQIAPRFSYCDTRIEHGESSGVYAQAIRSEKGDIVVLINKKPGPRTVRVSGASGKTAFFIDEASGYKEATKKVLESDVVELTRYATVVVRFGGN